MKNAFCENWFKRKCLNPYFTFQYRFASCLKCNMIQKWILLDLSVSKFNCKSNNSMQSVVTLFQTVLQGVYLPRNRKKKSIPNHFIDRYKPMQPKKLHWKACCVYTLQVPVYDSVHAWSHIPYMQILHKVHVA